MRRAPFLVSLGLLLAAGCGAGEEIASGVDWQTNASTYRGRIGLDVIHDCPPDGMARSVWGTDVYTDDSSVCTAAVHAGLITLADGGVVTITMRPGRGSYDGSTRNGIVSSNWPSWGGSFVFVIDPDDE